MMQLCRSLFSSLLENNGMLSNLLLAHFEPSRFLYDDIINNGLVEEFSNYIYSLTKHNNLVLNIDKTPQELLSDAGYNLYECNSMDDVNYFMKYYREDERLCSFNSDRIDKCYIFFAVKKNVDSIKREDFKYPRRQDEYGTSVISIQFTKGKNNTLSIKNRYNHTVDNPDATFSNNLDAIIPGLSMSFCKKYKLNLQNNNRKFELPGYVMANNEKFYKYNYEINNVYYCLDNIIVDNFEVVDTYREKEKYIIIDYFIIDLINKKIILYNDKIRDSFVDEFKNIEKITILRDSKSDNKNIEIIYDNGKKALIVIDKTNKIIEYYNNNLICVASGFLGYNKILNTLDIPNLERAENGFLRNNECLTSLCLPKIREIGNVSIRANKILNVLKMPNLERVGNDFCYYNNSLNSLYFPNTKVVGNGFFCCNKVMRIINMLNLENSGRDFFKYNNSVEIVFLPSLRNGNIANKRICELLNCNLDDKISHKR